MGQYWFIFVQVLYMIQHGVQEDSEEGELMRYVGFVGFISNKNFDISDKNPIEQVIVATYFALTSLSTVGLGDFYPVSNLERLFGSLMLLAGVLMMSYVLSELRFMIKNFNTLNGECECKDELEQFLILLEMFNYSK